MGNLGLSTSLMVTMCSILISSHIPFRSYHFLACLLTLCKFPNLNRLQHLKSVSHAVQHINRIASAVSIAVVLIPKRRLIAPNIEATLLKRRCQRVYPVTFGVLRSRCLQF